MSEHDWMPTEMKGVIGIRVEEYERLKADSKRLDTMDSWTVGQWEEFYEFPLEEKNCRVRDVLRKLEEQDHE